MIFRDLTPEEYHNEVEEIFELPSKFKLVWREVFQEVTWRTFHKDLKGIFFLIFVSFLAVVILYPFFRYKVWRFKKKYPEEFI